MPWLEGEPGTFEHEGVVGTFFHGGCGKAHVPGELCPFTCPVCLTTSYNPDDMREGYCGVCHDWTHLPLGGGT